MKGEHKMKEKKQSHWAMLEIAEQETPGNTIDLWSRVESQMTSSANKESGTIIRSRKKQIAFGLVLVLLLIGSLFFVPAVRAFAEDIIQRMGIAFVNTSQYDDTTVQSAADVIRVTPSPSLTIAEIRERVKFSLLVPTWLPDDLTYIHRSVVEYNPSELEGSGQQVDIEYWRTANFNFQNGVLSLRANDGPIGAPPLLAESREQPVTINELPGIYVHGGWQDDGRGDPNAKMGILQWDDQADDAYLTWIQDGVTYLIEAHNLGLELNDLLRIAESMTSK